MVCVFLLQGNWREVIMSLGGIKHSISSWFQHNHFCCGWLKWGPTKMGAVSYEVWQSASILAEIIFITSIDLRKSRRVLCVYSAIRRPIWAKASAGTAITCPESPWPLPGRQLTYNHSVSIAVWSAILALSHRYSHHVDHWPALTSTQHSMTIVWHHHDTNDLDLSRS